VSNHDIIGRAGELMNLKNIISDIKKETNDPATTANAKIKRLAELKSALHEVHELINTFDENGGVSSSNSRLVEGKVQRNIARQSRGSREAVMRQS
jgi:hypothetical protein